MFSFCNKIFFNFKCLRSFQKSSVTTKDGQDVYSHLKQQCIILLSVWYSITQELDSASEDLNWRFRWLCWSALKGSGFVYEIITYHIFTFSIIFKESCHFGTFCKVGGGMFLTSLWLILELLTVPASGEYKSLGKLYGKFCALFILTCSPQTSIAK